ncbi:MAG TPA: thioredoxin fold domain-containing protein, partial [Nitrospirota bacterium]
AQTANSLEWYSYEDALVKAGKEKKFVIVDFYANWCKWCKKLDSDTFTDPRVAEALKASFVPVKIDAESSKPVVVEMKQTTMQDLAESYGVTSYPSLWFVDPKGEKAKLLNGYLPPDAFLQYLAYIYSGKYKDMEFEDYVMKGTGK